MKESRFIESGNTAMFIKMTEFKYLASQVGVSTLHTASPNEYNKTPGNSACNNHLRILNSKWQEADLRRKYEPKIQKSGSEFHGFYFALVTPTLDTKRV